MDAVSRSRPARAWSVGVIVLLLALAAALPGPRAVAQASPDAEQPGHGAVPVDASLGPVPLADLPGRLAIANDGGIAITDASFAEVRQLTRDGGFDPTWSPDGTKIAYRLLQAADDGEIWIVDVATGETRDLVNDPDFSDWGPDWSPDGTRIAYSSNRDVGGGIALFVMNADGSDQHPVIRGHGEYPTWSPDGSRIAYEGGDYYDVRIVNADGTDDHAVTTSAAYDGYPAWSPDGEWIAYVTQADYYPTLTEPGMGPEMEIHVMRPDGSDDRRVTNDREEDYFPTWTPDGRYLTWSRHGRVVVARPDGTGMVALGDGNFPDWSP